MRPTIAMSKLFYPFLYYILLGTSTVDAQTQKTFSVEQVHNPSFTGFQATGPAALAKAYAKFGKFVPQNVKNATLFAAEKFQPQGSTQAQPEVYDSAYLCPVKIGSPEQTLFLDFDTGSADLWVFSSETSASSVNRQKLYNPSKSKTSTLLVGASWTIGYGDGSSASGDVYIDTVNVGGVVVKHQAVESAKQVSASFVQDSALSGLLGLGSSTLNRVRPNRQQTFFENVKGLLNQGLFTADLRAGAIGSYDFGFIDQAKLDGPVVYTTVNSTLGYWQMTVDGYVVGKKRATKESIPAIVDTGTSLILLPDDVVQNYYSQVKKATYSVAEAGWILECIDTSASPPDLSFLISGYNARVPGSYLNYAPSQTKPGYCFGGLQSSASLGINILGDVFIKSQFVVFDGQYGQIGFAPKNLTKSLG